MAAGSSADRAGVREGDRIIELGGKVAELDLTAIDDMTRQPAGTKLPLVIERDGKRASLQLELFTLLAE